MRKAFSHKEYYYQSYKAVDWTVWLQLKDQTHMSIYPHAKKMYIKTLFLKKICNDHKYVDISVSGTSAVITVMSNVNLLNEIDMN